MSNSRRWKEFITWWNEYKFEVTSPDNIISNIDKKIKEIKERQP